MINWYHVGFIKRGMHLEEEDDALMIELQQHALLGSVTALEILLNLQLILDKPHYFNAI